MRTALASLLLLVSVSAARAQDATPAPAGPVEIPAPRAAADSASELPAAVAEERITVSSDYRGSYITVFGVNPDRRGRGGIVVVVRGPGQTATLALSIYHFVQLGRDAEAFTLLVVSVVIAFAAVWLSEWFLRRRPA